MLNRHLSQLVCWCDESGVEFIHVQELSKIQANVWNKESGGDKGQQRAHDSAATADDD